MWSAVAALRLAHVLLAILAVGASATSGFVVARSSREPARVEGALRGVESLDRRVVKPAYALLLATGIGMLVVGHVPVGQAWLVAALVLYAALVAGGALVHAPGLRKQARALRERGPASPEYRALARRGALVATLLVADAVAILFLMIAKPGVA